MQKALVENRVAVILIGPQGSGKGTQASLLRKQHHFCYIAGGDIARELAKHHTELAKEVRELMNEGKLLPDHILNRGVRIIIDACSPRQSLLFDGYPRTLGQAHYLYNYLNDRSIPIHVIELELDDAESIARIRDRFVCSECGSIIYKLATQSLSPVQRIRQKRGRCIHCGGTLAQRSDDSEDSVRKRLSLYHKETKPVLAFFHEQGVLQKVDAKPAIEHVAQDIQTMLRNST